MRNLKIVFAIILATSISGCASLIGQTANQPITSSPGLRTAGTLIEDELIENKILVNFTQGSLEIKNSHINVVSFNENVLLIGQVPTQDVKNEAQRIAESTRKVKSVHNELQVAGPTSLLIRSNDTYLTSRAKVNLLASQNANGIRVKVISENGTVFLMGLVTRNEGQAAVNEIVNISGVRRIVKVFEYID
ncbi:MAG: BON domain-containing protein [Oceanospirillaceae bacterium]|nr:BON domain-containing protein [Oceanospirillaceae bacterium]